MTSDRSAPGYLLWSPNETAKIIDPHHPNVGQWVIIVKFSRAGWYVRPSGPDNGIRFIVQSEQLGNP